MKQEKKLGVRVLGPLEVTGERGEPAHLAPKPRTLFALLATSSNKVVAVESMVDELWEERPPRTATAIVQTYVGQLRREIGKALGVSPAEVATTVLITEGGGYRLCGHSVDIDVVRYTRLTREGCAAAGRDDHGLARDLLWEALSLWRGPALVNVDGDVRLVAQATRLNEARIATLEHWVRAEINAGGHTDVIGELLEATALHPLHETFHEYLALAFYRSSRRAEALVMISTLRGRLAKELGLDLSPRLCALQQAILRDDPVLFSGTVGPGVLTSRSPTGTTR